MLPLEILIRSYTSSDYGFVIPLLVQLQEAEHTVEPNRLTDEDTALNYFAYIRNEAAENGGAIFVAEHNRVVTGFIIVMIYDNFIVETPGRHLYIADIAVDKGYRQQGIGHKLMEQAERFARENKVTEIRISVLAKNKAATILYDKMGFITREWEMAKYL
jgi:ribosomal protein S18 acetylase RimI-like enzyme